MVQEKLRFFISEYEDGRLEVETNHIHYAFRDDLNYDYFEPAKLPEVMRKIDSVCRSEGIEAAFILK